MTIRRAFIFATVCVLLAACAGLQSGPSPEAKQGLAPTGKLRVALVTVQIYATKDSGTQELKGVGVDLGKELAKRLGVAFVPVEYAGFPAMIAGAKSGDWDIGFAGINAERAAAMDFSAPFMEVEIGYLARAGAPVSTMADVDKAGIRVGVLERSPSDVHLTKTIKNATLVRAKSAADLYAMVGAGQADVISTGKTGLFSVAAKEPGSKVLDGRLFVDLAAIGVPKGRSPAAANYVEGFVQSAKAEGLVKGAIDRAVLRGVVVAPPK